jgi:hypothetical protein
VATDPNVWTRDHMQNDGHFCVAMIAKLEQGYHLSVAWQSRLDRAPWSALFRRSPDEVMRVADELVARDHECNSGCSGWISNNV